jgi:ubiquitin C-terminal hydrolase
MGKIKKSFKEYSEENEEVRKRPLKKESRHNYKTHLMDVIETESWDELEDELNEQGRVHRR